MRIKVIYLLGLLLILAAGMNEGFGQSISVAPSRIFLSGAPGEVITQQLALYNTSKVPVIFKASLKDWVRDSLGEKIYFRPDTLKKSNASWLSVSPEVVEIAPGGKAAVDLVMKVPQKEQQNVTNSMLFFTQIKEQKDTVLNKRSRNIGVSIRLELGVHVYHTPPGLMKKNLEFLSADDRGLVPVKNDTVRRIAFKIKNSGEVVTDAQLRFEVTNKANGDELNIDPRAVSLLPGATQIVYLDLPKNLEGKKYQVVALLDYGTQNDLKVAEKEIYYVH